MSMTAITDIAQTCFMESKSNKPLVVTVRSKDRSGLVADISKVITGAKGNILDVGQHSDVETGIFGCRIEVEPDINRPKLISKMKLMEEDDKSIQWNLYEPGEIPKIVIACSTTQHCLIDLLSRIAIGELECEVVGVVSDRIDCDETAGRFNIPFTHIPVGDNRESQEERFAEFLNTSNGDLVVLARYMRILPSTVCEDWSGKMINIHHSFLPAFVGANPYRRAHERGVKLIGATAHYVTAELDAGPIIVQEVEGVSHRDSLDDLVRRGADIERRTLSEAVRLHLEHRVMVFGNRTCIFDQPYYLYLFRGMFLT